MTVATGIFVTYLSKMRYSLPTSLLMGGTAFYTTAALLKKGLPKLVDIKSNELFDKGMTEFTSFLEQRNQGTLEVSYFLNYRGNNMRGEFISNLHKLKTTYATNPEKKETFFAELAELYAVWWDLDFFNEEKHKGAFKMRVDVDVQSPQNSSKNTFTVLPTATIKQLKLLCYLRTGIHVNQLSSNADDSANFSDNIIFTRTQAPAWRYLQA
jgi:hypothetical protein